MIVCITCPAPLLPDIRCKSTVKADIVLLVDETGSISPDLFQAILGFLSDIVRSFEIGPDNFQFGNICIQPTCTTLHTAAIKKKHYNS